MPNYAVVDSSGVIINTVIWDGESDWEPPKGTSAVLCNENDCKIGGKYNKGKFYPPEQPVVSQKDLTSQAELEKDYYLNLVATSIAIWQTKLLMGRSLTDEETSSLNSWLDFSDLVDAVDVSKAPITWPSLPK